VHILELSRAVTVLRAFLSHAAAARVHVRQGRAEQDERDCSRVRLSVSICSWMGTGGRDVRETKTMARSAGTGRPEWPVWAPREGVALRRAGEKSEREWWER